MAEEVHVKKLLQKKIGEAAKKVGAADSKKDAETLLILSQALAAVGEAKYTDPNSSGNPPSRGSRIVS